jgi:hypothetical protein
MTTTDSVRLTPNLRAARLNGAWATGNAVLIKPDGLEAILKFTEPQTVATQRGTPI